MASPMPVKGIRYHYYTSAQRLRFASDDPQGIRVPAGDLERVVITAIVNRLKDERAMQGWLRAQVHVNDLPILLARCTDTAKFIMSPGTEATTIVRSIIQRVEVSKLAIRIEISEENLAKQLQLPELHAAAERPSGPSNEDTIIAATTVEAIEYATLRITITSHLLRCGKQVKLILGRASTDQPETNPRLVEMIVKVRRWYQGLTTGRYPSLRAIATEEHCNKSHVSRLLTIAFLAPDLVERILSGTHAASLTVRILGPMTRDEKELFDAAREMMADLRGSIENSQGRLRRERDPDRRQRLTSSIAEDQALHDRIDAMIPKRTSLDWTK